MCGVTEARPGVVGRGDTEAGPPCGALHGLEDMQAALASVRCPESQRTQTAVFLSSVFKLLAAVYS